MRLKDLNFEQIQDSGSREAFKVLKSTLAVEPLIVSGFKLIEIAFKGAGTFQVAHGLGFQPTDVLQSSLTGGGALTWNYDKFDGTNLNITVTGPCTVRAFVGAYRTNS